ncbi:hypothetical protein BJ878DRAFT_531314 [Calycina marina]|uniref:Uncharacterized protein n=1 Tax=Calycina marina TaxID=1763456 RepID=A0A9P8CJB4_9HELO|nr:hypothetical protein BJ878DRAFT_531314 [Calycina marina]
MPAVAVKGAIIVASVVAAAAIAIYESPQARQFAEDVRRRIAIALHSLGDEINPPQTPRFNRPEDAEGFMQSSTAAGVDADEESKKRQREELMYWNAIHLEKLERQKKERPETKARGSSFDDFLKQDVGAEKGTMVLNTGADSNQENEGLRSRGLQGLNRSAVYANPFADEHHIDWDEQRAIDASLMSPEVSEKAEAMSEGLYSAHDDQRRATIAENLAAAVPDPPVSYPTEEDMESSRNYTNMSERDNSAFASIHAWADNANSSFYSPLPTTPRAASPERAASPISPSLSDPGESVPGEATPTYSASVLSAEEVWAPRSVATSEGDIMSVDGISTPGSWTEVGSVVSDNDVATGSVVQGSGMQH